MGRGDVCGDRKGYREVGIPGRFVRVFDGDYSYQVPTDLSVVGYIVWTFVGTPGEDALYRVCSVRRYTDV